MKKYNAGIVGYDGVAAGKEAPLTNFADTARTNEVLLAADKSAATGKAVKR